MNIEAETVRMTKTKPTIITVSPNFLFDNQETMIKFKKNLALKIMSKEHKIQKEF